MRKSLFTFMSWPALLLVAVLCFPVGQAVAAEPAAGFTLLPFLLCGVIDIFDTRTMLEAVEQMKRSRMFLRDMCFPPAQPVDTETVDVDIIKGKRRLAPFVSPLSEGKRVDDIGFSTSTLKPGYIKPFKITTAQQLLHRLPGNTIYQGGQTIEQRAQIKLGQDLGELMDMIDRREEWMAAKAMDSGIITMKIKAETGDKTVTVDFQMANSHKITLAGNDLWSDTTNSDPVAKLRAVSQMIAQDSGLSPDTLILGSDAATAFINHPKVKDLLNFRRADMGEIKVQQLPNGVSYLGQLRAPSLFIDVYTYDEWFIDEDTDTEGPMVPVKKAWMCSTRCSCKTLYAVIQDMEAIEGGQAAVSRFPKSWIPQNPSVRHVMVQSAPLVAMLQPDAFASIQVLA